MVPRPKVSTKNCLGPRISLAIALECWGDLLLNARDAARLHLSRSFQFLESSVKVGSQTTSCFRSSLLEGIRDPSRLSRFDEKAFAGLSKLIKTLDEITGP